MSSGEVYKANSTAVLFIIFNRPNTTAKVFEVIREVKPLQLFIAADAPRVTHPNDAEKNRKVKEIVANIDWPCEVHHLYREQNLGCGFAVSEAINWFFSHVEEGIILEDDCVPHPDFFRFASEMLELFRENKQIISINGSNLGYKLQGDSYCFSRFMNMWGWATWRDRSLVIDYELKDWKENRFKSIWVYRYFRQRLFDFDFNWYKLWEHKFDKVSNSQAFTWDWQWMYYQLKHKQYSVVPAVNLVSNIGFAADATHTHEAENPAANIPVAPMVFPLRHPERMKADFAYEEHYVKWVWCYHKRLPLLFYIKMFLSGFFKK